MLKTIIYAENNEICLKQWNMLKQWYMLKQRNIINEIC